MHKNAAGKTRKEIVKQVKNKEKSVKDYANYVPIGNATKKLQKWKNQGIEIIYLTSRAKPTEINAIKTVLKKCKFPNGKLEFRKSRNLLSKTIFAKNLTHESYANVAERIKPNVLIEDDCESIGGEKEMTITNIKPNIKKKIKSIVVKEFEGIDELPESFTKLK